MVSTRSQSGTSKQKVREEVVSGKDELVSGNEEEKRVGLVYDKRMSLHKSLEHPEHERPKRIKSIYKTLKSEGIVGRCTSVPAREATQSELEGVHTHEYIKAVRRNSTEMRDADERKKDKNDSIFYNNHTYYSALLAAGSVVEISQRVARGEFDSGAAVVRPPGHHAERNAAMGFCFFNNVAVAAQNLVHGNGALAEKVLIVDWDVHHGNGIQEIFWDDPKVLYFSIHRKDLYPRIKNSHKRIGGDSAKGFNINVPWPPIGTSSESSNESSIEPGNELSIDSEASSEPNAKRPKIHKDVLGSDSDYLEVFKSILMPVAQEFQPDLVLVAAGFDAAAGDPFGNCELTPAGYSQMTKMLLGLAKGRLVLALEGGYDIKGSSLSKSFLACMKVLLGDAPEDINPAQVMSPGTHDVVEEVRNTLREYWPALSTRVAAPGRAIDMGQSSNPSGKVEDVSAKDANADLAHSACALSRLSEEFDHSCSLHADKELDDNVKKVPCTEGVQGKHDGNDTTDGQKENVTVSEDPELQGNNPLEISAVDDTN